MRTEELLQQSQSLAAGAAEPVRGAAGAAGRAEALERELEAAGEDAQRLRGAAPDAAGGAAADERGARGEGRSCSRSRTARIEIKNREIEEARSALEEKAEQLALSSNYKSRVPREHVARAAHAAQLAADPREAARRQRGRQPRPTKQVEFAKTIHNAGSDLLELINDILDLSKVEAGKMDVHAGRRRGRGRSRATSSATFRPVAEEKELELRGRVRRRRCPPTIDTDEQRLQQVLKNLLSNAFKFTEQGGVVAARRAGADGAPFASDALASAERVIGFSVVDTGIGIAAGQAAPDLRGVPAGRRRRRAAATAAPASASRSAARSRACSAARSTSSRAPGEGSTFTLYLPALRRRDDRRSRRSRRSRRAAATSPRGAARRAAATPELDPALLARARSRTTATTSRTATGSS